MSSQPEANAPGLLELIESARTKYTLAMARVRRGPPELALLSVHGSLEDILRAHGLRLGLPEAYDPFPQLLVALTGADQLPLSAAEADSIRRMHRLRARVAHGEQIVVAAETLDSYHRLAARLLPRYGVVVVPPSAPDEDGAPPREPATATTVPGRRGDTTAAMGRDDPATRRRGDTAALDRELAPTRPRRERTVYPDDRPARYASRMLPSAVTRDLPLAREMLNDQRNSTAGRLTDMWERSQRWLLPAVIVISIFLIGLVISASLGQMRGGPVAPTAVIAYTPVAGAPLPVASPATLLATVGPAAVAPTIDLAALTPTVPGPTDLAVGRTAYVRADAGALNVRQRPGTTGENPIQVILDPGSAVQIIAGPTSADGMTWWQISAAGTEGWCAGQYLEVR
jgi:hypothetical protein